MGGGAAIKKMESSKSFLFIHVIGNFMIIIGITILFSSSSDLLYFLSLLLQLMLLIFLAVIYDIIIIIIDLEIITFTIIII